MPIGTITAFALPTLFGQADHTYVISKSWPYLAVLGAKQRRYSCLCCGRGYVKANCLAQVNSTVVFAIKSQALFIKWPTRILHVTGATVASAGGALVIHIVGCLRNE